MDVSHLQDEVEGHNPYGIFEDQLDHEEEEVVQPEKEQSSEESIQSADGLSTDVVCGDPRSPTEGIARTPLAIPPSSSTPNTIEEAVQEQQAKSKEGKAEKPQQNMIKTMYKDLIRKDPIYNDLLLEDEWSDAGKTTPVKKTTAGLKASEGERTPLGCLVNKTRNLNFNSTPIKGSVPPMLLNDIDKIDGDENTPVEQQISRPIVSKSVSTSGKTRIPLRARRLQ